MREGCKSRNVPADYYLADEVSPRVWHAKKEQDARLNTWIGRLGIQQTIDHVTRRRNETVGMNDEPAPDKGRNIENRITLGSKVGCDRHEAWADE
jgi:hypothetical protein